MCWEHRLRPYVLAHGRRRKSYSLHLAHCKHHRIPPQASLIYRYIINTDKYLGCSIYYLLASSNRAPIPALAPSLFIARGDGPLARAAFHGNDLGTAPSHYSPVLSSVQTSLLSRSLPLRCDSRPPSTAACLRSRPVRQCRDLNSTYTASHPPPTICCKYVSGSVPYWHIPRCSLIFAPTARLQWECIFCRSLIPFLPVVEAVCSAAPRSFFFLNFFYGWRLFASH